MLHARPRHRARLTSSVVVGAVLAALVGALVAWAPGGPANAATAATAARAAAAAPSHPGIFHPLTPARLLDTTAGAGATVTVAALGQMGVPAAGVGAVVLNLTVASPTHGGYLTAFPFGTSRPTTSNLNFTAGRTVANLAIVQLGGGGAVSLYNSSAGPARVIADVSGYYESGSPTDAGAFQPLAPQRVLDTGIGLGATAASAASLGTSSVQIAGAHGVPSTGAAAVVLNVTVASPPASGYATVFPSGTTRPGTSSLNFPAGRTVPNLVTVKLGPDGKVNFYNGSLGAVRFVADVFGYYLDGSPTLAGTFQPLAPARILDTRHGLGVAGIVAAHGTIRLDVNSKGGLPPYGGGAVALNVTVTGSTASGYLTVYPTGVSRPATSNLNFVRGQTVANAVIVRPGDDGFLYFTNSSTGAVHVIADVSGSFVPVPAIHFRGSEAIDLTADDVSCASASFCVVTNGNGSVVTRDGAGWSAPVVVTSGQPLAAVSCPNTTFCAVAGQGTVELFNGTSWSAPMAVDPSHDLVDISCVSSSFCLAINNNAAFTYNGSTWSSAVANQSGLFGTSVSCATASYCLISTLEGSVLTWDGSTFLSPVATSVQELSGVSCVSASFCLVVGELGEWSVNTGSGWSTKALVAPSGPVGESFEAVTCRTTTFCVTGSSASVNAYTFDGQTWTRTSSAPFKPVILSCGSTSFCLAISTGAASVGTLT